MAMNINSGEAKLVLLCPAWKKYGTAKTVKPGTVILHSRADDVIPFADSAELILNSGLGDRGLGDSDQPASSLIELGNDHRLADQEPLEAMLRACVEVRSVRLRVVSKNLRQLGELSLSVLISAPLMFGSLFLFIEYFREHFSAWWAIAGSLVFWSFSAGICFQMPKCLRLGQALLEGVGLGLLTVFVNFILLVGVMSIWLAFFFAT